MSELRKAAEMVLKALEEINKLSVGENAICLPAEIDGAMEALRQALAQPEQGNSSSNYPITESNTSLDKIVEQAIQGHASTRDAIRWAMRQAYWEGVASGMAAERKACIDICDKIEKEAYQTYHRKMDAYDEGVGAGAGACLEEIARRK